MPKIRILLCISITYTEFCSCTPSHLAAGKSKGNMHHYMHQSDGLCPNKISCAFEILSVLSHLTRSIISSAWRPPPFRAVTSLGASSRENHSLPVGTGLPHAVLPLVNVA